MGICETCQACLRGTAKPTLNGAKQGPKGRHHDTGHEFWISVQAGCQICAAFWQQMKDKSPNLDPDTDPTFQPSCGKELDGETFVFTTFSAYTNHIKVTWAKSTHGDIKYVFLDLRLARNKISEPLPPTSKDEMLECHGFMNRLTHPLLATISS